VSSAAYNQWAAGYGCTARDQVTSITARGAALLVSVRAQESGGVIQTYRFSYIVKGRVPTHPQMLSFTGYDPQGCENSTRVRGSYPANLPGTAARPERRPCRPGRCPRVPRYAALAVVSALVPGSPTISRAGAGLAEASR
jgi:hypothetical protein